MSPSKDMADTHRSRHPRFFFQDGNVIFLVEGTLFKVHRFFFKRDSPVFKSMFSLPSSNERPEGETEEHPIVLQGFKSLDFGRFLSILYPLDFLDCDLSTMDEWTSVLIISSIWEFTSLRLLAIDKLSKLARPVDRIVLGRKFDIFHWLTPAYYELCTLREPLNMEEGVKLGIQDVIKIGQVRHQIRYVADLDRHEDTIVTLLRDTFSQTK